MTSNKGSGDDARGIRVGRDGIEEANYLRSASVDRTGVGGGSRDTSQGRPRGLRRLTSGENEKKFRRTYPARDRGEPEKWWAAGEIRR